MLERYHRELLNFLSRLVNDRDTAADLVQESYVRVLAVQQSGQTISDARALLYHTARNLVVDRHRRAAVRRHEDIDNLLTQDEPLAPHHVQPEMACEQRQQTQALLATIAGLPPRCREAFVLARFEGLSHQQVAERMGISKNMVTQHVVRAVLACQTCEDRFNGATAPKP